MTDCLNIHFLSWERMSEGQERVNTKFSLMPAYIHSLINNVDAFVSHFTLYHSLKRRAAFTLAEVLITLGVIGIVAALTIPTLIANHQKKVYVTQFEKAYNTVQNAFKLMLAETGTDNLSDNDFISAMASSSNEAEVTRLAKKYFNIAQDVKHYNSNSAPDYRYLFYGNGADTVSPSGYLIKTADGANIYLSTGSYGSVITVHFDVNGSNKGPNTSGRDYFSLFFYPDGKLSPFGFSDYYPTHFCSNGIGNHGLNNYGAGAEPYICAERILLEGWQMNY